VLRKHFKEAQRIAHLGNWSLDIATQKVTWSDEKYRHQAMSPEVLKRPWTLRCSIHAEDVERVMGALEGAIEIGNLLDLSYRTIRPDGQGDPSGIRRSNAEVRRAVDGKPLRLVGTVHDVTEVIQIQKYSWKRRRNAGIWRSRTTGLGVWDWNIISGFVLYTDPLQVMLGYEPGSGLSMWTVGRSRVHPDDLDLVDANHAALSGRETKEYICEHRLRCKDGGWKWVHDVNALSPIPKTQTRCG